MNPSWSDPKIVDRVEAIVNKKAIFRSDVDRFIKTIALRQKIDPLFQFDPISKQSNPGIAESVQFLISEATILEKFPIADSEVETEVNNIQGNLKIDRAGLREALAREGFDFKEYFELMRIAVAKRNLIEREIRNKAAVTEEEIESEFFRKNSNQKNFFGAFDVSIIKTKTEEAAQTALGRLKKGDPFSDVAKDESVDPSAESGGHLGFLSYQDMQAELREIVRRTGPQKTSEITKSADGFMIVKVGDVRAEMDPRFQKEKEALRAKLMEGEYSHQVAIWIERQRHQQFVKIIPAKNP